MDPVLILVLVLAERREYTGICDGEGLSAYPMVPSEGFLCWA